MLLLGVTSRDLSDKKLTVERFVGLELELESANGDDTNEKGESDELIL